MAINVLFVCLGNICRSPTAHGVFQQYVNDHHLDEKITVDSAGVASWHIGDPPDERSVLVASERGYDLSELRARKVSPDDFSRFDYVIAMDVTNLADLQRYCPDGYRGELDLFLNYIDSGSTARTNPSADDSVPDPYFGGTEGFHKVVDLAEQASQGLLEYIMNKHELKV